MDGLGYILRNTGNELIDRRERVITVRTEHSHAMEGIGRNQASQ
jgi:hypothetical protein